MQSELLGNRRDSFSCEYVIKDKSNNAIKGFRVQVCEALSYALFVFLLL